MTTQLTWQASCFARLDSILAQDSQSKANWYIGLSGGLDSCVLLHIVNAYCQQQGGRVSLSAIHVNHGISAHAYQWQAFCEALCHTVGVSLSVRELASVLDASANVEARARAVRYQAFAELLPRDACLLLAHHQNDQAETFLYRALRGGGSSALAAMPVGRRLAQAQLMRPLLSATRAELEAYALEHGLSWVDDDSNQDTDFDRNFLRHKVLPLLSTRWPQAIKTLSRSAELAAQTDRLAQDLAQIDLAGLDLQSHWGGLSVARDALAALPTHRQSNVLRCLARQQDLSSPSQQQLAQLTEQLEAGSELGLDWGDGFYRQSFGRLFCSPTLAVLEQRGLGQLEIRSASIDDERLAAIEVVYRQGGERLLWQDGQTRSLKKQMMQWQIPLWWRKQYPLLRYQGEIIAVAGFYTHPQWQGLVCYWS